MRVIYPDHTPFERVHSIEKSLQDYYPNVIHNVPAIALPKTEEKGINPHEKNTRKSPKSKSKKVSKRTDKSAMA